MSAPYGGNDIELSIADNTFWNCEDPDAWPESASNFTGDDNFGGFGISSDNGSMSSGECNMQEPEVLVSCTGMSECLNLKVCYNDIFSLWERYED